MDPLASRLSLRRYGAAPGSHHHVHYQVLWGWRGVLELEIEGRGSRMSAGRVAVIPPGARHDFQAVGRADCFVLDTPDDRLASLGGRVLEAPPALPRLFEFLQAQPPALLEPASALLLQSLWSLQPPPSPRRPARAIDWAALEAWVDTRLDQPLDVAALAVRVHLSPSQLSARCMAQWGLPPLAWVRARRLAAARRWRAQGLAVAEVARRCGYRSPSALTAALRRSG